MSGGRVSINLTGVTLSEPTFLSFVQEQLRLNAVAADTIIIEITENSALTICPAALKFMTTLRECGLSVCAG